MQKRFFVRFYKGADGRGWALTALIGFPLLWLCWKWVPEWYPCARQSGMQIGWVKRGIPEGSFIPSKRLFWHEETCFQREFCGE